MSTIPFNTLTPTEIPWLWPQRLPLAQISLLASRPGEGKSLLTADIAARISTGSPWPDGSPCPRGSVIFIPGEDDPAQVIRPRLLAQGADLSKVHVLSAVHDLAKMTNTPDLFFNLDKLAPLDNALLSLPDCKLVIFDPISAFFAGFDIRQDFIIRKYLASLVHLAQRHGPAILLVHHLRSRNSGSADQRLLGGQALASISRNIWHLLRDPQNKSRRLFLAGKSNFAPESSGLSFTLSSTDSSATATIPSAPKLTWELAPIDMNADQALATLPRPGPPPIEREAAESWLKSLLSEGPLTAGEIRIECECAGLFYRTVQRAADHLNIQRHRATPLGQWTWQLPTSEFPAPSSPKPPDSHPAGIP